jgi:cell division protein FtsI (penicillin-binding protein 3)
MKNEVLARLYIVFVAFIIAAIFIMGKAFKIAIVEGDEWRQKKEDLYIQYIDVEAERGNILSDDGTLLVTSLPLFEVRMDMAAGGLKEEVFQQGLDSLSLMLHQYIDRNRSAAQWKQYLKSGKAKNQRYYLIAQNIEFDLLEKMKKFPIFNKGRNGGGLIVIPGVRRERPFKLMANRTLGLHRKDAPSVGLEAYYDQVLTGESGKQLMQKIPPNIWIPVNDLLAINPKPGKDIVSTLNVDIQDIAHNALLKAMKQNAAQFGTAIVMDVKTGEIKALANLAKSGDSYWEDYNYGVAVATEPGSTFKLPIIMAMLEDGLVNLEDSIDLNHGAERKFYGLSMKDAKPHRFKTATIRETFEISSNVGIAMVADKVYNKDKNAAKLIERLKQFRLNEPVGIDLSGEAQPYIKEAYNQQQLWSKTTVPWMATGYECRISPLQMLTFYNAVANDGVMVKPYLVKEIRTNDEVDKRIGPTILRKKIASDETIRQAKELLEGVVLRGTAKDHQSELYTFAGKTGTAVIDYATPNRRGSKKYQASFVGYFPAENPKYSVIVVINDPQAGKFYGGAVAAPVFKEIADYIVLTQPEFHETWNKKDKPAMAVQDIPANVSGFAKELERVYNHFGLRIRKQSDGQWASARILDEDLKLVKLEFETDAIPDVRGMGIRDALFVLENRGHKVHFQGAGRVKSQHPQPGSRPAGQMIELQLN